MFFDVVVVGGGIAGSAFAGLVAERGVRVLVLEKTVEFADENRGEMLWPWGVREAQRLGVYESLVAAGGHVVAGNVSWSSLEPGVKAEGGLGDFFEGVDGSLNLGHPVARQTLLDRAMNLGAVVRRGVDLGAVSKGTVSWVENGDSHEATCRLIVGADGRRSTVRREGGFGFRRGPVEHYAAGVLLASDAIPSDANTFCREAATHFLSFPQVDGQARVYQCVPTEEKSRFSGTEGHQRFLEGTSLENLAESSAWSEAEIAGPLGTFPCGDSWVDSPVVDGFALIGDAGGYNNLLIGQGLSLALRDARILGELMTGNGDWTVEGLDEYATERTQRLATQRFTAHLSVAVYGYFRNADDDRRAFAELLAQDDFLNGFRNEIFLGGLTRTAQEVNHAQQTLEIIEQQLHGHNAAPGRLSQR
jgi:2-polyprenyl-6-methoxyphenol hydroxylase-like FAD-dependent oxidoreductase